MNFKIIIAIIYQNLSLLKHFKNGIFGLNRLRAEFEIIKPVFVQEQSEPEPFQTGLDRVFFPTQFRAVIRDRLAACLSGNILPQQHLFALLFIGAIVNGLN